MRTTGSAACPEVPKSEVPTFEKQGLHSEVKPTCRSSRRGELRLRYPKSAAETGLRPICHASSFT
jgi:hypothetical protein